MRKNLIYRPLMVFTGILAVAVILLSQSVYKQTQTGQEKAKTEQTSDQDKHPTFVSAPTEAVTSSPIAEVNEQVPSLLEEFVMNDREEQSFELLSPLLGRYIKTLFRVIISPNAP